MNRDEISAATWAAADEYARRIMKHKIEDMLEPIRQAYYAAAFDAAREKASK